MYHPNFFNALYFSSKLIPRRKSIFQWSFKEFAYRTFINYLKVTAVSISASRFYKKNWEIDYIRSSADLVEFDTLAA